MSPQHLSSPQQIRPYITDTSLRRSEHIKSPDPPASRYPDPYCIRQLLDVSSTLVGTGVSDLNHRAFDLHLLDDISFRAGSIASSRGFNGSFDPDGIYPKPHYALDRTSNHPSDHQDTSDSNPADQRKEPTKPGAYQIYKTLPGQSITHQIEVPGGVEPGTEFAAVVGNRRFFVRCPDFSQPGQFIEVTLPPEYKTHFNYLKPAPLTSLYNSIGNKTLPSCRGGARPMIPDIRKLNDRFIRSGQRDKETTHIVTIPSNVQPGESFMVSVNGRRLQVTCPPNTSPGKRIRIVAPPLAVEPPTILNTKLNCLTSMPSFTEGVPNSNPSYRSRLTSIAHSVLTDHPKIQGFQVEIPKGVRSGEHFEVLVTLSGQQEQHLLVKCPANTVSGQTIKFQFPTTQSLQKIKLKYESLRHTEWIRTVRAEDLQFQWVRLNDTEDSTCSAIDGSCCNPATKAFSVDSIDMEKRTFFRSAFVRMIVFLEGNDKRLGSGLIEFVPANKVWTESKIVWNNRAVLSYTDIAVQQSKPFRQKHDWFCQSLCKRLSMPCTDEDGPIRIYVRRSDLLRDSIAAIMSLNASDDMRKQWRIQFLGEPVVDGGGPTREWFELVTDLVFNPDFGLWIPSVHNQARLDINGASDVTCPHDYLICFRFIGRVLGRALFDRQLVPKAHMVRTIYKHILGWPITVEDLRAHDEAYFESLQKLAKMDDVSTLCLDFTITEERMGAMVTRNLVELGTFKEVNNENLAEYLELNSQYRMLKRTMAQLAELLLGFYDVIPEPALTIFDVKELELMLCGCPTIDVEDWQRNTEYKGLFEDIGLDHEVIQWFWDIISDEYDIEMRARLLQFSTGTSGVPVFGFSGLQGTNGGIRKFTIHGVNSTHFLYPKAHTCFNRIDLPTYETKDLLSERLRIAVLNSFVGFGIE